MVVEQAVVRNSRCFSLSFLNKEEFKMLTKKRQWINNLGHLELDILKFLKTKGRKKMTSITGLELFCMQLSISFSSLTQFKEFNPLVIVGSILPCWFFLDSWAIGFPNGEHDHLMRLLSFPTKKCLPHEPCERRCAGPVICAYWGGGGGKEGRLFLILIFWEMIVFRKKKRWKSEVCRAMLMSDTRKSNLK